MAAQYPALPVHEVTGRHLHMTILPQEAAVVPVRHKTDILTVRLVGVQQPRLTGALPDGGLVELPHRQQQVRQLVLRQLIQHIALILPPVPAPQQPVQPRLRIVAHTGIVARSQIVVAQHQRPLQQRSEFQAPVAVDAGIGGVTGAVFRHEVVHDVPCKPFRLIEYIELHPQPIGHAAGIVGIVSGAAGTLHLAAVQLQHGPVAGVALLLQ